MKIAVKLIDILKIIKRRSICIRPFKLMNWINSESHKTPWEGRLKWLCLPYALCLFFVYASIICLLLLMFPKLLAILVTTGLCFLILYFVGSLVSKIILKRYKNIARAVLKYMCFLLLSFFLTAFVCSAFDSSNFLRDICYRIEFPFASLKGIAVDSTGRVYCGIALYSRIQVYDKNGYFLHGWFTHLQHTSFNIAIDEEENVRVAKPSADHYYNSNGKLLFIKKRPPTKYDSEFGLNYDYMERTEKGETYMIKGILMPEIKKIDTMGNKSSFISAPIYLWITRLPLPAFIFMLAAFIIDFSFFSKKKKNAPCNPLI